jgi:uridine monophosphate synthetase
MSVPFFTALAQRAKDINSLLCVGLDPHSAQLPEGEKNAAGALKFCLRLIEATSAVAVAYKPNAAFFECFGAEGADALKAVVAAVPAGIPVLLDCKRGDISTTAAAYADAAFDVYGAHGVTLSPYMGRDSLEPFLTKDASKGAFVLCKTSNGGSADFQALALAGDGGELVYENVARRCEEWGAGRGNLGLVVGATDAEGLRRARAAAPGLWILAPGLGAQGGDLEAAVEAAVWADGAAAGGGIVFPVSRGISKAADPAAAAADFRDRINAVRERKLAGAAVAAAAAPVAPEGGSGGQASEASEVNALAFIEMSLGKDVLRFGEFTLKSGRVSPYFFNAGHFDSGLSLLQLGRFYARRLVEWGLEFDVIFGPAYKGITLAAAIAIALADVHGRDVPYAYNRKEAKDHGEKGNLVGAPMAGKRVLVVDDVITAGTAIRESMVILTAAEADVVGVMVALDRQEKGREGEQSAIQSVEAEFGIPCTSIATLVQLQAFVAKRGAAGDDELLAKMAKYRADYGVC